MPEQQNIEQNGLPEKNNQFIIFKTEDDKISIDVRFESETVWLTQQQLAELFQSSRTNIVEHIKHIFEEGELNEKATCRNFRQVQKEGNREVSRELPFYNLDMIISLGYRINSKVATKFRQWATTRLKEYIVIATAFFRSGYVESWGRGMDKMKNLCLEANIPVPQFSCKGNDFWAVFRKDIYNKEDLSKLGLNERQIKAVLYVKENGKITNSEYQELNNISRRTATDELTELVDSFLIFNKIGTSGSSVAYELIQ